jgi:hypothetical protein
MSDRVEKPSLRVASENGKIVRKVGRRPHAAFFLFTGGGFRLVTDITRVFDITFSFWAWHELYHLDQ